MPSLVDWLIENEPEFRKYAGTIFLPSVFRYTNQHDRSRLPSLYSDLTVQKQTNPEGYSANATTWQAALTRAALEGQLPAEQHLILQASDELLNALASPQYGRPTGLGCVLDDAARQGKMIDVKDFLTTEKSIYSRSWVPSPLAILRWSLRQVGVLSARSYDDSGRLKTGSLVIVPALEEMWKKIQMARDIKTQSLTDRIMSREMFIKDLNSQQASALSDQDISVLLRYLSRDKQALTHDATTIKYKSPTSPFPDPITQEDHSIANLKSLISSLMAQITTLHTRIAELQHAAQTAVKQGNKQSALSALRSKKFAERTLDSRTATLHQLEEVYTKIESAVDQVQIVAAMEASAGVLKSLNQKTGGVERVDNVLETLREEMGKVDEVSGVIAEPLDGKAVLDEGEVDDELELMERQEREKMQDVEAEETRRRIADIEAVERKRKEKEKEREKESQAKDTEKEKESANAHTFEQELSRSTEKAKADRQEIAEGA
jgi:charged multivesicular body protein 7